MTPYSTLAPEHFFYQSLGYQGLSSIAYFLPHFRALHSEGEWKQHTHALPL